MANQGRTERRRQMREGKAQTGGKHKRKRRADRIGSPAKAKDYADRKARQGKYEALERQAEPSVAEARRSVVLSSGDPGQSAAGMIRAGMTTLVKMHAETLVLEGEEGEDSYYEARSLVEFLTHVATLLPLTFPRDAFEAWKRDELARIETEKAQQRSAPPPEPADAEMVDAALERTNT